LLLKLPPNKRQTGAQTLRHAYYQVNVFMKRLANFQLKALSTTKM